jgi:hypothetical protein
MALLVLGAVLLPIAGLSLWARNQLLNTDRYVATTAPLAEDPAVQAAIVDRVSEAATGISDIEARAREALPDRAKFLAAPIAAAAKNLVHDLTGQFVASDQFPALWAAVNRTAHDQIVAILEGTTTPALERDNGQVILSLGPIVEQVLHRLDAVVPVDLTKVPAERLNVKFVLADSSDLARAQSAVEWFNRLTWVLLLGAIAALVAGVLVAPDRRRGLQRTGLGVVFSMGATLLLYGLARERYLASLPSDVRSPAAAAAAFDIATRYVSRGIRTILVVGVVLFVAAWLPGPSRSATWLRLRAKSGMARGSDELASRGTLGGIPTWVAGHTQELHVGIVGLAVAALLVWGQPTGKVVLLLTALVASAFGAVQLLGGARSAHPADKLT